MEPDVITELPVTDRAETYIAIDVGLVPRLIPGQCYRAFLEIHLPTLFRHASEGFRYPAGKYPPCDWRECVVGSPCLEAALFTRKWPTKSKDAHTVSP